MDVDDFIRDDKSAAVFLNEMIKLDSGDGSMVRLAIGNIIKCHNVSEIAKTACVSRASTVPLTKTETRLSIWSKKFWLLWGWVFNLCRWKIAKQRMLI